MGDPGRTSIDNGMMQLGITYPQEPPRPRRHAERPLACSPTNNGGSTRDTDIKRANGKPCAASKERQNVRRAFPRQSQQRNRDTL